MALDKLGREIPDPHPVAVPLGMSRPLPLREEMRRFVRAELSRQASDQGEETFEEADDFDIDEDPDPISPYEVHDLIEEWPQEPPQSPPLASTAPAAPPPPPDASVAPAASQPKPTTPDQPAQ